MRPESIASSDSSDTTVEPVLELVEIPPATEADAASAPRSRRSLLAAALGGVAGAVAGALGRPAEVRAASGDPVILGQTNFAGSAATRINATSSGGAFWMTQYGFGSGVKGDSVNGHGGVFTTQHGDRYGLSAGNTGGAGAGAAVRADGGSSHGVIASTGNSSKYAVQATAPAGGVAIYGESTLGVKGYSSDFIGVYGESNTGRGVAGYSNNGSAIQGQSINGYGVEATGAAGVYAYSNGDSGTGVHGIGNGASGHGVVGIAGANSSNAGAVYGEAAYSAAFAGYFVGKVTVTGTLAKGGGSFRIDHPLDPENKVLQHSFVESPDMLNIYNGVVRADANGEATVELPDWFMALNRDFRYGLTPIGEFAPLYVKSKVAKGRFTIAGAAAGQEVSWQLTGIRQDAWANANRIEVELDKSDAQRGLYLHPAEHGKPASKGVDFATSKRLRAGRDGA